MPFVYEPITSADREQMESLKIMIHWKKPNAEHWTVNRETDDFLVRIAPDREPPYWIWFAFWWKERLFRVGLNPKSNLDTEYCLEIAGIGAEDGKPIPSQDKQILGAALLQAVKTYATAEATEQLGWYRKRKNLPLSSPATHSMELECTLNDLSMSPFAIFRANFHGSI